MYIVALLETEVHRYQWAVEANNEMHAIAKALEGDGELLSKDYIRGTDESTIVEGVEPT